MSLMLYSLSSLSFLSPLSFLSSPFFSSNRSRSLSRALSRPLKALNPLLCVLSFSLTLNACSLRTECLTGMTQCSEDEGAILVCERGFWMEGELCAEGQHCMSVDLDASSDEHSGHGETEVMVMCMPMSPLGAAEAGAEGGSSGGLSGGLSGGAVDHSGHSLTLTSDDAEGE